MKVEQKFESMGLAYKEPPKLPPGVVLTFPMVRVVGNRAFISGHGPMETDGSLMGPFGKLGADVTVEEGYELARHTAIAMVTSLKNELGDLDRVKAWGRVFGMVNSAAGFTRQPEVINGFTDLIHELFGDEVGRHARSAVGMAELPFGQGIAVEIEAEVIIND